MDINCPNCKEEVSQVEIDCENCGFPLSGTDKEKSIFIGRQISNKAKIGDAKESQAKAKKILYVIGALQLANAFLVYGQTKSFDDAIFYFVLAVLFGVFAYLSPKKPILFLSLALALLLGYYAFLYFIDPELIFRGILWKIVFVSFLVYGIWNANEERELKKKHSFLNKD
ncbi:hypothetical protein [Algibacter sp. 2305UL17-15]|uniref:hypothetical protein n=1 Tax=Algibacter sp. 2305UL17-15 TaxID=3231268 RepID=UPI00345A1CBB